MSEVRALSEFAKIVKCRRGLPWRFRVNFGPPDGLSSDYTLAHFTLRENFDDTSTPIFECDQDSGISFDYPENDVVFDIGALATGAIDPVGQQREVAAFLTLTNGTDSDDTIGFAIPFLLQPSGN